MKLSHYITWGLTLAIAVGFGVGLQRMAAPRDKAYTKLIEYCTQVHVSLDLDAVDLESGDPKRQRAASDRFAEPVTFHSTQEIALCSKAPVDLRTHDTCWLRQDFACLAELAKTAAAATK